MCAEAVPVVCPPSNQVLRQGLSVRMRRYGKFQDAITARACVYFKFFLQSRDYDGDLRFNHDKETLSMEVCVC